MCNNRKNVTITLTPDWQGDTVTELGVEIVLEAGSSVSGELFSISERVVNRSFNELLTPLSVCDELGPIPCSTTSSVRASYIVALSYRAERETSGDIRISYRVAVREGEVNPVFDFGSEPGGAVGCAITFLPRFAWESLSVELRWELDALPELCSAVWTYGEGSCRADISSDALELSVFTVGRLKTVRRDNFCFAWIDNSALDGEGIARWMAEYITKAAKFFRDERSPYVIATRSKIYTDHKVGYTFGGTAFICSYAWLYDRNDPPSVQQLTSLFPHESIHNWIKLGLDSDPFGLNTWYIEGMAEYYCAILPYRFGLITAEKLCELLNGRWTNYSGNPHIHTSNMDCGKLLFKDPDATRIPYQRGFFYLSNMDARIRSATKGEKCLDDIMFAILERQRGGEVCGVDTWLELTSEALGCDTRPEYESMADGSAVQYPSAECTGGALYVKAGTDEHGNTVYSYEVVR